VIRWYTLGRDVAPFMKVALAVAALVSLVIGAGADWRWD
jgi:hypothetical protein